MYLGMAVYFKLQHHFNNKPWRTCLLLVEVVRQGLNVIQLDHLQVILALPGIVYPLLHGSAALLIILQLLLLLFQVPHSDEEIVGGREKHSRLCLGFDQSLLIVKSCQEYDVTCCQSGFGCAASGHTSGSPGLHTWTNLCHTCGKNQKFARSSEQL